MRERVNSDGFLDLTTEDETAKEIKKAASEASDGSGIAQSLVVIASENPLTREDSQESKPVVEMLNPIVLEKDYILTSHLGDWQKLFSEYSFSEN